MKKLFYILLAIATISFAFISKKTNTTGCWICLADNEYATHADLIDGVNNGVFTATGTTIPNDNELFTKSEAATYVQVDVSNSYYAALASNECVVKRDVTPSCGATDTLYSYALVDTIGAYYIQGTSTSDSACTYHTNSNGYDGLTTTVCYYGTLAVNTYLNKTSISMPNGFTQSGKWYYLDNNAIKMSYNAGGDNYQITNMVACSTTGTCNYSVYKGATVTLTYTIYKNGSVVYSGSSATTGTISFNSGDTFRAVIHQSDISGTSCYNKIILSGALSGIYDGTDTDVDTGTQTVSSTTTLYIGFSSLQ